MRQLADRDRMDRCSSYVDSIIERDVSAVHPVRKPDAVRRLIYQAASRTAQELNGWSLARDLAVKYDTVSDYLDALTRLGIILRLGAWSSAEAKREVKSPKLHLMDTGLATALRGEDSNSFGLDADPTAFGSLFETFVFTELEKSVPFLSRHWSLWHWRADIREIDILAEAPDRLIVLFKMKATSNIDGSDFRHINWFLTEGPGNGYRGVGFVVYLENTCCPSVQEESPCQRQCYGHFQRNSGPPIRAIFPQWSQIVTFGPVAFATECRRFQPPHCRCANDSSDVGRRGVVRCGKMSR